MDLTFRCVADHHCKSEGHPKYLRTAGTPHRMYNVSALFANSSVIALTEGELDAITVAMCGVPAVGVPGANGWRRHYRRLLEDFATVLVLCDGDEPGRKFGVGVARELDNAKLVTLPDGQDANSLYLAKGRDAILSACELGG